MAHASGDHCPECFNAGYDAGLNGISRELRDAAPELLAALKSVVTSAAALMCSTTCEDSRLSFSIDAHREYCDNVGNALALIARLEGR